MRSKITEWLTGEGITVLAVVIAACLLIILAGRLLKKIFRHMEERLTWDNEHERAWKALRQAVRLLVTAGIILAAVVIIVNSLGFSFSQLLGQESYTALNKAFKIFLIVAMAFIVDRLTRVWIYQAFTRMRGEADLTDSRKKRIDTLGHIVNNAVTIVIGAVAALMVISEIGLDLKAILMGAGVVGVAVGFGAQNLVRDFLGGFFILMEDQYSVGDVISAGGHAGLVQAINLRTTVLRDAEGKVHIIPNGEIKAVTNMTKEWSACVLNIGVAYKEDIDRVIDVLKGVGDEMYNDEKFRPMLLGPLEIKGVNDLADSAVMIMVSFRTKPIKQWDVGRELRRRVKNTFDREGIEIPFPHRTVYIGEGKQGKLPIEKEQK